MLTVLYAILVFGLVICVHELGHLLAAKAVGIRVNEFSIGMGPKLLQKQGKETLYSLRLLPLGGYNKLEGEDGESDDPRAFVNAPVGARMAVIVSGAVMNFLTCVLILILIYASVGYATTRLEVVPDGYPAAEAGIASGDVITGIDGHEVKDWNDVLLYLSEAGDTTAITVRRGQETKTFETRTLVREDGQRVIGIQAGLSHSLLGAVGRGFTGTVDIAKDMVRFLGGLFRGQGSLNDFSGPVGIVTIIAEEAKEGFVYVANLAAIISLNLGIMNMLPLPALDGGRFLFLLLQAVTGKPVSPKVEGAVHGVGMILLLLFAAVLIVKDVGALL